MAGICDYDNTPSDFFIFNSKRIPTTEQNIIPQIQSVRKNSYVHTLYYLLDKETHQSCQNLLSIEKIYFSDILTEKFYSLKFASPCIIIQFK
jgi:hypothetical protein